MAATNSPQSVGEEDLKSLKERMKMISDADPQQYHNDFSLRRYLRAFKTVDSAFKVYQIISTFLFLIVNFFYSHLFISGHFKNKQVAY